MSIKTVIRSATPKPTISLNEKELPEIKKWKVGGKYRIMLDVEQVSAEKGDSWGESDSKRLNARFKVLKAEACESD